MLNEAFKFRLKLVKEETYKYDINTNFASPEIVVKFLENVISLKDEVEEYFYILTLDTKHKPTGIFEVSHGSLNASIVHPREVFKRAILANSSSIFLFHNHPSGETSPSKEDIGITKRLVEAGKLLGVSVLDHIIIGNDYHSMRSHEDIEF